MTRKNPWADKKSREAMVRGMKLAWKRRKKGAAKKYHGSFAKAGEAS